MADQPPWARSNAIMNENDFSMEQIRLSQIWAAKDHECPKCHALAYSPCRNLTGIKKLGFDMAKENRYPHSERIDWLKLNTALLERGYRIDG